MPAYVIARINVTDPDKYEGYKALAQEAIAGHGGRYLVRGGPLKSLEGEPDSRRVVVLEFPTMQAAETFYRSAEYQAAKAARAGAAEAQMVVVEGHGG